MCQIKVSVIIPVYNVEPYISECLASVVDQTYSDLEIIIVDDCSTDRSYDICQKFAEKDPRILLLKNEKNSGVSFSRNQALEIATGKYIAMIDSDDWIEKNTVEIMVDAIEKSKTDVCVCGYIKEYEDKRKSEENQIIDETEIMDNAAVLDCTMRKKSPFVGFAGAKMYKASVIKDNKLRFDNTISICEDSLFSYSLLDHSDKSVILKDCLYHYRIRQQSATRSVTSEKIKTKLYAFQESLKIAKKYPGSIFYYRINATLFGVTMQYLNIICSEGRKLTTEEYKHIMRIAKESLGETKIKYVKMGELIRYYMFLISPGFAEFILTVRNGKRSK